MEMKKKLEEETKKWLERIETKRKKITLKDEGGQDFLKNIDAYISDSKHFLQKDDLIRAFEAVIWAWAYMEIGEGLGIVSEK
jgi:hypothetical protein